MQTLTIDILNNEAYSVLNSLENLQLIKLHQTNILGNPKKANNIDILKFKGKLAKQGEAEIEKQFNDLRNDWE